MLHLREAINYFSFITRRVVLIPQLALVLLYLRLNSASGNFYRESSKNTFPILGSRNAANLGYREFCGPVPAGGCYAPGAGVRHISLHLDRSLDNKQLLYNSIHFDF